MIDWDDIEWEETIEHPEERTGNLKRLINLAGSPILAKMRESTAKIVKFTRGDHEMMGLMWYGKNIKRYADNHSKIPCIYNPNYGGMVYNFCDNDYIDSTRGQPLEQKTRMKYIHYEDMCTIESINNKEITVNRSIYEDNPRIKTYPLDDVMITCLWSSEITDDDLWHDQEELVARYDTNLYLNCHITACSKKGCKEDTKDD